MEIITWITSVLPPWCPPLSTGMFSHAWRNQNPGVIGCNHGNQGDTSGECYCDQEMEIYPKRQVFPRRYNCPELTSKSVLALTLFILVMCLQCAQSQLIGTTQNCSLPNGTPVHIEHISDNACIDCFCQDGVVECRKAKCQTRGACPWILKSRPKYQCCPCKGCFLKGKFYESGQSWTDPRKPCKRFTCEAGVITAYKADCHVICKHPIFLRNGCCPVCEGCSVDGVTYSNGESFPSPRDAAAICTCLNGTVECVRGACPVLNCPDRYVYSAPGSVCPQCSKSRSLFAPPKGCLFRHSFTEKHIAPPDSCTECRCDLDNQTVMCVRKVCPVLHCPPDDVISDNKTCCPVCKRTKKPCRLKGKSYKHGTTWWPDECTTCECDNRTVRCHVQQCPNRVDCPKGQRLSHIHGKCCPVCIDSDAVCAVFGDPHYKTFDGLIYNFQGMCRYVLVQDCHSKNFTVKVRNDARQTNDFAWTKSVSIHLRKKLRISLHQNLKVRVNGKVTSLPFEVPHVVDVVKGGKSVILKTTFGLKVVWDGDSYLEVTVPPWMKNRVCGLCGNYNGIQNDDFVGRNGGLYFDANEFAETWRLGKGRTCGRSRNKSVKVLRHRSLCDKNVRRKQQAEGECSILRSKAFSRCRAKVDVGPYYMSCVVDVCDCPPGKQCSCEAVMAYSRQCAREGARPTAWRTPSVCGAPPCPRGAVFNICASACPRTCANLTGPTSCDKPCHPACQCPYGTVLKGQKCVKPDRCHRANKKQTLDIGLLAGHS